MIIILCNTNSQENAELIAQTLVSEELCACVNIIPKIQSIYKWQGKIENDTEFLMLIKTKNELFEQVKNRILELHPYEVPEVISFDITNGNKEYLDWVCQNTKKL